MNFVIYYMDGQVRSYACGNKPEFDLFMSTMKPEQIVYLDGKVTLNVLPDDLVEDTKTFINTISKQYNGSATFLAPTKSDIVVEVNETPKAVAKPKKARKTTKKTKG